MERLKYFFLLLLIAMRGSVASQESVNSYDLLPCPTAEEFETLSKEVHLVSKLTGGLCDSSRLSKLGRLLKLAARLEIKLPRTWQGGATAALESPIRYLGQMIRSLQVDFKQVRTTAYNKSGDVFLGALFFQTSPLSALATLVHEARHSAPEDPRHITCIQGDLPFDSDACDEWFRTDDRAGAYALQVSFLLGLQKYGPILSQADREYLKMEALSTVGTRFNRVPSWLALPFDVIATLDNSGIVNFIHPFLLEPLPSGIRIPGETIVRLEADPYTNGLRLFTQAGRVFQWSGRGIHRWQANAITQDRKIRDIASLTSSGGVTSPFLLDEANQIHLLTIDPESGAKRTVPAFWAELGSVEGKRLLGAGPNRRYLFAEDGVLYYFEPSHGFPWWGLKRSLFQSPQGWSFTMTGVLSDIFAISDELFYKTNHGSKKSIFQFGQSKKYIEGVNLRALLSETGRMKVAHRGEEAASHEMDFGSGLPTDIAMFRIYLPNGRFDQDMHAAEEVIKSCELISSSRDPWLGKTMGLDKAGSLVFEGHSAHEPCLTLTKVGMGWTSFSFSGTEVPSAGFSFPRVTLRLSDAHGRVRELRPYQK